MRQILIELPEPLFEELQAAAACALEMTYTPAQWATECIIAELASRRLPRVRIPIRAAECFARKRVEFPEDNTDL